MPATNVAILPTSGKINEDLTSNIARIKSLLVDLSHFIGSFEKRVSASLLSSLGIIRTTNIVLISKKMLFALSKLPI